MQQFSVGDKVSLITSPDDVMTVCSVFGQRLVECTWTGKEGKIYKYSFRPESLQLVSMAEPMDETPKNNLLKIDTDESEDDPFSF